MAEEKDKLPAAADVKSMVEEEEQDVIFKVQMKVAHVFLGYWRYGLGALGVVLAVALVIGLVRTHARDRQREVQAAMSRIDRDLPEPSPGYPLGPMDDPADAERTAKLERAAKELEAVAGEASGTAGAMAWIRAAEVWERARKVDEACAAWGSAHGAAAPGLVGWAAASGRASCLAAQGKTDDAAAILRQFATTGEGLVAQQALLDLGTTWLDAGRRTEAVAALEELKTKYPESPLAARAAAALEAAREAG